MAELNTNTTTTTAEPTPAPAAEPITRTFTQEEVSTLCAREAGRAERAILKQFGLTDKSGIADLLSQVQAAAGAASALQTATGERDNYKAQYEQALTELNGYKNAAVLAKYGVADPDDVDYYTYKIGKRVTKDKDFEAVAKEYFEEHPANAGRIQLAPDTKGNTNVNTLNDMINKRLRGEL